MNLQIGKPVQDGLYVVFVDSGLSRQWKEPYVVLWTKGHWCHRNSSTPYLDTVRAWMGPVNALSNDDVLALGGEVSSPSWTAPGQRRPVPDEPVIVTESPARRSWPAGVTKEETYDL